LSTEQLQTRYCEIIGRTLDASALLPEINGAFGWLRTGAEWSAVLPVELADVPGLMQSHGVVERRDISLQRWFTARAAVHESSITQPDNGVITHA
jgi:ABC-2 type transport system ATP-binding protein